MYGELYQYLVLHKQLPLPGIGTFLLERKPADIDFASKLINPPAYSVSLHHGHMAPIKKMISWLAAVLQVSEQEASSRFTGFITDMKNKLTEGTKLEWNGIGTLTKGLAGEIRFDSLVKYIPAGTTITASKVIRENAEHAVRVGELEKTSTQMIALLNPEETKKNYQWLAALIVTILATLFIIYYFVSNGFNPGSAGNQQKLVPHAKVVTYEVLQ